MFSIQRYMGDGDEEQSHTNNVLQKILEKAERKKRESLLNEAAKSVNAEKSSAENKHYDNNGNELQESKAELNEAEHTQIEENEHLSKHKTKKKRPIETQSTAPDENAKKPRRDSEDAIENSGFTILGSKFAEKQKVKASLAHWLAHPTVISADLHNLTTRVKDLKQLDSDLRKVLKKNGITHFFPVQAEVIPWLLESYRHGEVLFPRDVCVSAPTGSGKTLAYVLPIIQALRPSTVKKVRALVILPTQELAKQVFLCFKTYTKGTGINTTLISTNSTFQEQQKLLVSENKMWGFLSRADIVVCTAGRLVDHLQITKGFNLQHLKFLVIDEADRVLESVQNDWLHHLERHLYSSGFNTSVFNLSSLQRQRPPQKLLFSATLTQDPEKLKLVSLFQPKLFTSVNADEQTDADGSTFVGKYTMPLELTQKYIETNLQIKPLALFKFLDDENLKRVIVFTNSQENAHRLSVLLRHLSGNRFVVEEISAGLTPHDRSAQVEKFNGGRTDVLICTDALARGIDLVGVQCVVSYNAPRYLRTYIHRAGRTARAGEKGIAVTMVETQQKQTFFSMLKEGGSIGVDEVVIDEDRLEPLADVYREALENLKKTVQNESRNKVKQSLVRKKSALNKRKRRKLARNKKNAKADK